MRRSASVLSLSVAFLLPLSHALADPVLDVTEEHEGLTYSHVDFGASDALGRAWAVVHYDDRRPCPAQNDNWCEVDVPFRVHVKGLEYDRAKKQVVFAAPGQQPVVCAEYRRQSVLAGGGSVLQPTGACTGRVVKASEKVDDGFDVEKVTHKYVVLSVEGQPASNAVAGK